MNPSHVSCPEKNIIKMASVSSYTLLQSRVHHLHRNSGNLFPNSAFTFRDSLPGWCTEDLAFWIPLFLEIMQLGNKHFTVFMDILMEWQVMLFYWNLVFSLTSGYAVSSRVKMFSIMWIKCPTVTVRAFPLLLSKKLGAIILKDKIAHLTAPLTVCSGTSCSSWQSVSDQSLLFLLFTCPDRWKWALSLMKMLWISSFPLEAAEVDNKTWCSLNDSCHLMCALSETYRGGIAVTHEEFA